jgi:hypothetical protein
MPDPQVASCPHLTEPYNQCLLHMWLLMQQLEHVQLATLLLGMLGGSVSLIHGLGGGREWRSVETCTSGMPICQLLCLEV